jgi:CheY-like chemotaxis protein
MYGTFILLVDNDRPNADVLKIILEYEEFKVDVVYSGEAALEMMKLRRYSHFLLDYSMPGMKGDQLAKRIRQEQPWANIMLLTGFGSVLSKSVLRRFDYVFEKPANPRLIIQAIKLKGQGDDLRPVESKKILVTPPSPRPQRRKNSKNDYTVYF